MSGQKAHFQTTNQDPLGTDPEVNSESSNFEPSTLNTQPSTLNPQPSTLNPQPSTLNPQPSTLTFELETPNHDVSEPQINPQPSIANPQQGVHAASADGFHPVNSVNEAMPERGASADGVLDGGGEGGEFASIEHLPIVCNTPVRVPNSPCRRQRGTRTVQIGRFVWRGGGSTIRAMFLTISGGARRTSYV